MFCPQLLAFLQGLFTFYHEGYELAHEFEPYKQQLQFNLQNVSLNSSHNSYPKIKSKLWLIFSTVVTAALDRRTLLYIRESWSRALNHTLLFWPFFLWLRPQRFQPGGPNFVFDLKCQHHCCANFSLYQCP